MTGWIWMEREKRDAGTHMHAFSRVQLFSTPWTVGHQAALSMGFPKQEYWSGLLFPFPDLVIKTMSPALADGFFAAESPGKPYVY